MPQQTIVITGASDGIGAAAARQLAALGARVVLTGRSPVKTPAVAAQIGAEYFVADFTDLAQVRDLAARLLETCPRIDVLANNAGGIMGARELTADGFEKTFQVNHLAPFLLTSLLLPVLCASSASVLQTSSSAARLFGRIDIDDLQLKHHYSPRRAYGAAKLENILFTRELHRRYHADGISAAAFHPGVVATGFASDTTHLMRYLYQTPLKKLLIGPDKGADQLVWLARTAPGRIWQSGEYYEKRKPGRVGRQAGDAELARQLWVRSARLLSITAT